MMWDEVGVPRSVHTWGRARSCNLETPDTAAVAARTTAAACRCGKISCIGAPAELTEPHCCDKEAITFAATVISGH